jgi:hypothetical protein
VDNVNYLQTVFSARGLESVEVYADLQIFLPKKYFRPKNIFGRKKFSPKTYFCPKNIFGRKIFPLEKYFRLNNIFARKIFLPEKYFRPKNIFALEEGARSAPYLLVYVKKTITL